MAHKENDKGISVREGIINMLFQEISYLYYTLSLIQTDLILPILVCKTPVQELSS